LVAVVAGLLACLSGTAAGAPAAEGAEAAPGAVMATVVEDTYEATGPQAVSVTTASVPGTPGVRLVYPTALGSGGVQHPIVAWGNGTLGNCGDDFGGSGPLLRHMASWGFAVVCLQSGWVGDGDEIWTATQWFIAQDANPSSIFYGKLDTAHVGAVGHSQGATGVTNATVMSGGVINSTVALALVNPNLHNPPEQLPEFAEIDTPIFFVSGTADNRTSEANQQSYFTQVAGPAAKAARSGANHDGAAVNTEGYWTAWLRYTLMSDPVARSAFVGSPPEIPTNPAWTNWAAKALP
jgi:hypothetical protein